MSVIVPTVGRVVNFFSSTNRKIDAGDRSQPLVALIAHVWSDRCVNLAVFDMHGRPVPEPPRAVRLVQPGDNRPVDEDFCEWMPYQVKKDTGSESGEPAAGQEVINGPTAEAQTPHPAAPFVSKEAKPVSAPAASQSTTKTSESTPETPIDTPTADEPTEEQPETDEPTAEQPANDEGVAT